MPDNTPGGASATPPQSQPSAVPGATSLKLTSVGRAIARTIGAVISRAYALALILVIIYLSYRSVAYLVNAMITPYVAPQQVRGIPKRLDSDILHGRRPDWLGLSSVETPRAPVSHYHRMDTWIASDPFNGCTQSGCHSPLPHARNKATRAFLNMHATSLHCGVCHMADDRQPLALTWYSLDDGRACPPPAVLRAYDWLSRRQSPESRRACVRADRDQIADLLVEASAGADGDPALRRIAEHIQATRPGRDEFVAILDVAVDAVVRSFRGSYGEKLGLKTSDGKGPVLGHPNTNDTVEAFLKSPPKENAPDREERLKAIHPQKRDIPRNCVSCHAPENGAVDFASVGYPQRRVETLKGGMIFQMIEHIGRGEPFQLPTFVTPSATRASTQPSNP